MTCNIGKSPLNLPLSFVKSVATNSTQCSSSAALQADHLTLQLRAPSAAATAAASHLVCGEHERVLQQALLLQVVRKVAQHVQDGLIHWIKGRQRVEILGARRYCSGGTLFK